MSVVGHWRRSVLGASGVALLLPLALAVGVGLTAALGGQASLRALGQVFAGPSAPARHPIPGLDSARDVPSVPSRARVAPAAPVAPAGGGGEDPEPDRQPPDREKRPVTAPEPDPDEDLPAEPGPTDPPADENRPADEPGSPAQEAVEGVADAAPDLPPPAGEVSDSAMETVVELIP